MFVHNPVMLKEVLEYLNPQPGNVFIDATINGGGHAKAITERIGKTGKLLGIDRDREIVEKFSLFTFQFPIQKFIVVCDSFAEIKKIAEREDFVDADGILFDLGFSSFHIESSGRGFSFLRDESLDMRYDPTVGPSAQEIINSWPEENLVHMLFQFGEERYARRIAKRIREERQKKRIETTNRLVEIIRKAVPLRYRQGRIHFATRTFQALRICVNDELEHVAKGVRGALSVIKSGGRIAVISFHSVEDRVVKNIFKEYEKEREIKRVIKKPVTPSRDELKEHPRSRSAKLRVIERI